MGSMIIPDPLGGLVLLHGVDSAGAAQRARVSSSSRWQLDRVVGAMSWLIVDGNCPAGTARYKTGLVPVGHVYVYTSVCAVRYSRAGAIGICVWTGGVQYYVGLVLNVAVWDCARNDGWVVVGEGFRLGIDFSGSVLGDDITVCATGFDASVT